LNKPLYAQNAFAKIKIVCLCAF